MSSATEGSQIIGDRPATAPRSSQRGQDSGKRRHDINTAQEDRSGSSKTERGRGGRRGGGRGRGGRGGDSNASNKEASNTKSRGHPPLAGSTTATGKGAFGSRPTEAGNANEGAEKVNGDNTQAQDDVEAEVCFICASPVVHNSVAPCNHRTCHICALRLRALYKSNACAHCRTQADYVIFTDDSNKRFEDFTADDIVKTDSNLGIKYEKAEIFEDTVLLLRYNCPDASCDVACLGWPDLHRHVRGVHNKVMCDLCTKNKKVFTHEHELFTKNELRKHERFGDDNPGAIDQTGFKGHPECGFCRQRFYGDDELYSHCRDKHERCHICDRRDGGRSQQYYVDYDALELHFRKDHFLCPDQECLEKKFVVFESEMDLKAHQLETHPHGLSKDARRDARRVDMSQFAFRNPHEPEGSRRREGRGRGRGRDPNAEPLPQSSAQPLRRDEVAYQRQIAIQSAQSVSNRTFGGQLTSGDAYAARPPARAQEPTTITAPPATRPGVSANDAYPALSSLTLETGSGLSTSGTSVRDGSLTPQEQARRLRHSAVTKRAASLLRNDAAKLADFRSKVSSFRSSAISASELIDSFFSLFDTTSVELGKLVKELADIFEIPSKRDELLKAWGDWKAINEDYPSLPGSSSGASSSPVTAGGSRVLKLKSSTAQSSRSATNRQSSWGSAASTSAFPPLASGGAPSVMRVANSRPGSTPWASASASPRPSPGPSRVSSQVTLSGTSATNNVDAFPALPAAAKPTSTLFSPGYSGFNAVRRGNFGGPAQANVWGGQPSSSAVRADTASGADGDGAEAVSGSKRKGNKNKKQTLFHFG